MKIHRLLLAAAFLPVALAAQEDRYAQITNPKPQVSTKKPPRSTFTSYTCERGGCRCQRPQERNIPHLPQRQVEIQLCVNFADRPTDFMDIHADVSKWPDIDVPGEWELAVSARLSTSTSRMSLLSRLCPLLGQAPTRLTFQKAKSYGNLPPYLHPACRLGQQNLPERADGVRGAAFYYLNGKFAGMSKDSKTPARFNVTSLARRGENVIAIQRHRFPTAIIEVPRISGASAASNGTSTCIPAANAPTTDFKAKTPLDGDYRNGILKLKVKFANETRKELQLPHQAIVCSSTPLKKQTHCPIPQPV